MTAPIATDENALGPRMFRGAQIKPAAQIDDRHHAAAKIHHAVDEGGRLRQPRDVIWTAAQSRWTAAMGIP